MSMSSVTAVRVAWIPGASREEVEAAQRALAAGGVVVVGVEPRDGGEGRGFLLGVAALATQASVNTMVRWGRGLTCFSVTPERAMKLGLRLTGEGREGHRGPIFLRTVEAATCEGTGISAEDRALTLRAAGSPASGVSSLKSPGHVMPVLVGYRGRRQDAPAELALELIQALTEYDVPAWTDVLDEEGELASAAYCRAMAAEAGLCFLPVIAAPA